MSAVKVDSLELLRCLDDGRYHSGETLSARFGMSRAALWKRIEALRELGVPIEAVPRRGYRLPYPVTPLDPDAISAVLRDKNLTPMPRLEVEFAVESTNTELPQRGVAAPAVLLAECQTGGRGRWGRNWSSLYGAGVYASLLWHFPQLPESPAGLGLAVASRVAEALDPGAERLQLKWPNDILADNAKLAGMLIEIRGEAGGPCDAVIGVGLNYRLPGFLRSELEQAATDMSAVHGDALADRNEIAALMISGMVSAARDFGEHGLAPFLSEWQRRDALAGKAISVCLPDRTIEGEAAGLAPSGALKVATVDGTVACFSGDVQLRIRR